MIRLDKFVAESLAVSRTIAKQRILKGRIKLNGEAHTNPARQLSESDCVSYQGEELERPGQRYYLLNKPVGYLCSAKDEEYPSALNLLPDSAKQALHFAGRLDQDTTGLVLVTDDGKWSHRVTSPRKNCPKTYRVGLDTEIDDAALKQLTEGVLLHGETKPTEPAQVVIVNSRELLLTISEGRYHQVKRMIAAVGNRVVRLHRESVGSLCLGTLEVGQWRELSVEEIAQF